MKKRTWFLIAGGVLMFGACTDTQTGITTTTTVTAATSGATVTTSTTAPDTTTTTVPVTVPTVPTTDQAATTVPSGEGVLVLDLAAAIPVAAEVNTPGYSRQAWPHWEDTDGDGCDARQQVLREESLTPAQVDPFGCRVVTGDWVSVYDQETTTNPGDLDVDHFVPLAETHRSGGWNWTREQRRLYANDTSDPRTLIAVTARSNRAKGDKDPAGWLPPNRGYVCEYVANWVAVKARWGLTWDAEEATVVTDLLVGECEGIRTAPIPPAPFTATPATTEATVPTVPPVTTVATTPTVGPFPNCAAARAAGAAPLHRGDPGYSPRLDRDGDGIACE